MMEVSGAGSIIVTEESGRPKIQGCGSKFNRVSGSGIRIRIQEGKMTHKSRKNLRNFMFLSA
jgi:hypothetical protein